MYCRLQKSLSGITQNSTLRVKEILFIFLFSAKLRPQVYFSAYPEGTTKFGSKKRKFIGFKPHLALF
jgi:hypothetical protein